MPSSSAIVNLTSMRPPPFWNLFDGGLIAIEDVWHDLTDAIVNLRTRQNFPDKALWDPSWQMHCCPRHSPPLYRRPPLSLHCLEAVDGP